MFFKLTGSIFKEKKNNCLNSNVILSRVKKLLDAEPYGQEDSNSKTHSYSRVIRGNSG